MELNGESYDFLKGLRNVLNFLFVALIMSFFSISSEFNSYNPTKHLWDGYHDANITKTFISVHGNNQSILNYYAEKRHDSDSLYLINCFQYEPFTTNSFNCSYNSFSTRLCFKYHDQTYQNLLDKIQIVSGFLPGVKGAVMLSEEFAKHLLSDDYPSFDSLVGKYLYSNLNRIYSDLQYSYLRVIDIGDAYESQYALSDLNPYNEYFPYSNYAEYAFRMNRISGVYKSSELPRYMSLSIVDNEMEYSGYGIKYDNYVYYYCLSNEKEDIKILSMYFDENSGLTFSNLDSYYSQFNKICKKYAKDNLIISLSLLAGFVVFNIIYILITHNYRTYNDLFYTDKENIFLRVIKEEKKNYIAMGIAFAIAFLAGFISLYIILRHIPPNSDKFIKYIFTPQYILIFIGVCISFASICYLLNVFIRKLEIKK